MALWSAYFIRKTFSKQRANDIVAACIIQISYSAEHRLFQIQMQIGIRYCIYEILSCLCGSVQYINIINAFVWESNLFHKLNFAQVEMLNSKTNVVCINVLIPRWLSWQTFSNPAFVRYHVDQHILCISSRIVAVA